METPLLQDLRAANQTITRFVSELSVAKTSPKPDSYSIQIESLKRQLNKIWEGLGSVGPSGLRSEELDKELTAYAVNLGLLKKAIGELEPSLKEEMQSVKAAIDRLGAASSWSQSLKSLSK
jgi:predicted  nucleic acid-binding Zn-ribbon protein